ncbi:MAG: hypothetical protein LBP36_03475 [Oscillospiraceae bacterium]|jgi:ASC-1-like (ASCH) protein|nr:hypothetical protein [Oscillospiraceae bacterium]
MSKNMYNLNIISNKKLPFLQFIKDGKKKAEGRIATDFIKSFKIGDLLKLIDVASNECVVCEIIYLNFYKSFKHMLDFEGFQSMVPFSNTFDEALKIYQGFPGADKVKIHGCCAIGITQWQRRQC